MALPAGGDETSGIMCWLPNVGDEVVIMFLDGEPEKPRWMWAMQDNSQAQAYPAWTRTPGGYQNGEAPKSALLTRYGHSFDFQPDTTTWRTASGFKLRFTNSTQQLDIYAPNCVGAIGSLKFTGDTYQFNPATSFSVNTATASVSANTASIASINTTLASKIANYIQAPHVELGIKGMATDPVVRLSDLSALATLVMTLFNAHVHPGVTAGHSVTAPPTPPMILKTSASSTTFTS